MLELKLKGREGIKTSEAVLGLGSNLGNKVENIKMGIRAVSFLPNTEILAVSHFYETKPFMVPDIQDMYVNACIKIFTKLPPHVLLGSCLGVEAGLGRERKYRYCARNIDIDLLLYDDVVCSDDNLILPHPGIKQRDFVMMPLGDICIDLGFGGFDFSKEYKSIDLSNILKIS